jgi:hypothetical protein
MVYAISSKLKLKLKLKLIDETELRDLIASTQRNVIRRTGSYQMGRMYPAGRSHAQSLIGRSIYHIIPEMVRLITVNTPIHQVLSSPYGVWYVRNQVTRREKKRKERIGKVP